MSADFQRTPLRACCACDRRNLLDVVLGDTLLPMATRYKSVEAVELVPLESFQSDPGAQSNMTYPDSRIMKKSTHAEYTQSYNAQAVVDADGFG